MATGVDWRAVLAWVALASAVGEVISAFFIEVPVAAIIVAALFLLGWFLLRRGGLAGVILVGVLSVVEVVFLPTYDRDDAADWILQAVFLVLGAVGIVASAALLLRRRTATA